MENKWKTRILLVSAIVILTVLMDIWIDELCLKQMGFLGPRYQLMKIILHSIISYKLAKLVIKKFKLEEKIKALNPTIIFLGFFLLLNAYIIIQYSTRVISNRFINKEMRIELNSKTIKLGPAGWGYESDSLTYEEFKELTKVAIFPEIPRESKNIYVHDWYEFDFRKTLKFDLDQEFDINKFYNNDTMILRNIEKLELDYDERNRKLIRLDTTGFSRYEWEVGSS